MDYRESAPLSVSLVKVEWPDIDSGRAISAAWVSFVDRSTPRAVTMKWGSPDRRDRTGENDRSLKRPVELLTDPYRGGISNLSA